jgi:hypothetical protein
MRAWMGYMMVSGGKQVMGGGWGWIRRYPRVLPARGQLFALQSKTKRGTKELTMAQQNFPHATEAESE